MRNILNLKLGERYVANDIGRRLESYLVQHRLPSRNYEHGTMNDIFRSYGITPIEVSEGNREFYLGRNVIPVVKELIKEAEDKKKSKQAKPKQMTIEEVEEKASVPTEAIWGFLDRLVDALKWYAEQLGGSNGKHL